MRIWTLISYPGKSIYQIRLGWDLSSIVSRSLLVESTSVTTRLGKLWCQCDDGSFASARSASFLVWQTKVKKVSPDKCRQEGFFHFLYFRNVQTILPSAAFGFILNVPSHSRMTSWLPSSIVSLKHWIAIRKLGDETYFNLDSHLHEPQVIGNVKIFIMLEKSSILKGVGFSFRTAIYFPFLRLKCLNQAVNLSLLPRLALICTRI